MAAGRPVTRAQAHLRNPPGEMAARKENGRHLCRRRRHPHHVRKGQGAHAHGHRSRHRQGFLFGVARAGTRSRPVHHGNRRRRGLHRLGSAGAEGDPSCQSGGDQEIPVPGRIDGAEGRCRLPLRTANRKDRRNRLPCRHGADRAGRARYDRELGVFGHGMALREVAGSERCRDGFSTAHGPRLTSFAVSR